MHAAVIAGLCVAGLTGIGAMGNEATHGGVAEMMGLGHHHMADYGGYHCASHDGEQGMEHMEHMHGDHPVAHDDCPGGQAMHHGDMMGGT